MKYRSLLKKKIYSLHVKDGAPNSLQSIIENGNDFGKIISIEDKFILAMLKIELSEEKIKSKQYLKTNDGLVLDFVT